MKGYIYMGARAMLLLLGCCIAFSTEAAATPITAIADFSGGGTFQILNASLIDEAQVTATASGLATVSVLTPGTGLASISSSPLPTIDEQTSGGTVSMPFAESLTFLIPPGGTSDLVRFSAAYHADVTLSTPGTALAFVENRGELTLANDSSRAAVLLNFTGSSSFTLSVLGSMPPSETGRAFLQFPTFTIEETDGTLSGGFVAPPVSIPLLPNQSFGQSSFVRVGAEVTVVPEPSALTLLTAGIVAGLFCGRRRRWKESRVERQI